MQANESVQYCVDGLIRAGADKAQCLVEHTEKHELTVERETVNLFRTTHDTSIQLTGICEQKKGTLSLNKLEQASLDQAVEEVVALANASKPDSAYAIAEQQPAKAFNSGPEAPDQELMFDRLTRFLAHCKTTYPALIQERVTLDFTCTRQYFQNSNGVAFVAQQGHYNFITIFVSKEGKKTSSFNGTGFAARHLDKALHEFGSVETLLQQSTEQTVTNLIPEKMEGDVIITPDCLGDFIEYITEFLRDYALISGTSIFKEKLHEPIADEQLTLHSRPVSEEIVKGYCFTADGYEAQNSTIIDKGVLNSFLLSLYGANKTGRPRAVNHGEAYVIEPGATRFDKMIRSVSQGILLCRFSGGHPGKNGDFSGVAKNSYYIEDGKIHYPLTETMISGNLATALKNIRSISKERINFGDAILPWVQIGGVTISGK